MAYAALLSLANTIDRFLNSNLYSISLEEREQITSLLEYVTPFQHFLEEFPDKFKSLEERMRDLANEAEDILEYLVVEKVYLCSDEESEPQDLNRVFVIKDFKLKLRKLDKELREDFADEALQGRFMDIANEAAHIGRFLMWEKDHIRYRDKWRFVPAEFAKFKSTPDFIDHLNKIGNEIDSIMAELMSMKKNNSSPIKESALSSGIDIHDDDDDDDDEEEEDENDDDDDDDEFYRSAKHELQPKRVMEEIALIAAQVKEIKASSNSKQARRGAADSSTLSSSSTAPPIHKVSMVGFEDRVLDMKDRLCGEPSGLQVIPICGMGGIGKTTLARNLYDDPLIVSRFDIRVWITISQDYSAQKILSSLVKSLEAFDKGGLGESDEEKVHKILFRRRYLVVMDDIWSGKAWDVVKRVFPNEGNGSRVMLTTRLSDVASYPDPSSKLCEMSLLNEDESWNLLKQKVFADEECPFELENIGKEIARRCKGLPLALVVIAGLVSTVSKNPASWHEIAEKVKSTKTGEQEQIEEILSLSYTQLPQYLRPCFLYMGSFPEDDEIHVKKLIRLWVAEGFMKSPTNSKSLEEVGEECLEELVKRNLALVTRRKLDGRIKKCSLHDLMRDLCVRKAHESKFFLNLMDKDIEKECFIESIRNQRRISVDSSYLRFISSDDDSTIRSIRCSKYHLVKLEFVKSVRLLRVLDTEPADVGSSPSVHQLCRLFHLRYLAIKYMESIPGGLSKLRNLQTLIIDREKRDKFFVGVVCHLELSWCMPQLRHVHFHGTIYFEDPLETTSSLESLQTLSHVAHWSCTERILKRLPNLKKLKIDCSRGPHPEEAAWLNDLVHLQRLENLEVYAGRWVEFQPKHYKITYPSLLRKLTLRDLRFPSSNILVVGSLPNLQMLKLIDCTCKGGKWETTEGAFPSLEVLLIGRSSFDDWITESSSHFPKLKSLLLHHCWVLNGIPEEVGDISTLELIEVEGDVKKSLVKSAKLIKKEQEYNGNDTLQVRIAKSSRPGSFSSNEEESSVDDDDDDDDVC